MKKKLVLTLVGTGLAAQAGVLRENQVNLQALAGAVAVHRQGHGVAGLHVGNIGGDGAGAGHLGVANGGDDVIGLQARAGGFLAVDLTHQEPGRHIVPKPPAERSNTGQ